MSNNLNQAAWTILFERHKILEKVENNCVCYISAKQIKKEREPRLMAKFDHTTNLPKIFSDNRLSILHTMLMTFFTIYILSIYYVYKNDI